MEEIARALDDHEYETVNSFILQRAKAVGYTISDLLQNDRVNLQGGLAGEVAVEFRIDRFVELECGNDYL